MALLVFGAELLGTTPPEGPPGGGAPLGETADIRRGPEGGMRGAVGGLGVEREG